MYMRIGDYIVIEKGIWMKNMTQKVQNKNIFLFREKEGIISIAMYELEG